MRAKSAWRKLDQCPVAPLKLSLFGVSPNHRTSAVCFSFRSVNCFLFSWSLQNSTEGCFFNMSTSASADQTWSQTRASQKSSCLCKHKPTRNSTSPLLHEVIIGLSPQSLTARPKQQPFRPSPCATPNSQHACTARNARSARGDRSCFLFRPGWVLPIIEFQFLCPPSAPGSESSRSP